MLTQERLKEVLHYDPDSGQFTRLTGPYAGRVAGYRKPKVYNRIWIDGVQYFAHRLVWLYVYGRWPLSVDHADGDPGNNALRNLREATPAQNRVNASAFKNSTTGVRGVHFHAGAGKYRVQVMRDGRSYHGGYFASLSDAENAAIVLAREVHGQFACDEKGRQTVRGRGW